MEPPSDLLLILTTPISPTAKAWRIVCPTKHIESFLYDCFLENCPKSALFGVFDGHGGVDVSRFLVKALPQVVSLRYRW